ATIVTLHQPKAKTPAERAKAYRDRKREKAGTPVAQKPVFSAPVAPAPKQPRPAVTPVTRRHAVTPSQPLASLALAVAAFALAAVGVTMNGWFARSLGSSDIAGWLFLALVIAADLAA